MLAYHRGTWREGVDELPDVAALDVYMCRYGWTYDQYCDTPMDVLEELAMVIQAENEFKAEKQLERLEEENRERSKQGLRPVPIPSHLQRLRRRRNMEVLPTHADMTREQIITQFMAD